MSTLDLLMESSNNLADFISRWETISTRSSVTDCMQQTICCRWSWSTRVSSSLSLRKVPLYIIFMRFFSFRLLLEEATAKRSGVTVRDHPELLGRTSSRLPALLKHKNFFLIPLGEFLPEKQHSHLNPLPTIYLNRRIQEFAYTTLYNVLFHPKMFVQWMCCYFIYIFLIMFNQSFCSISI